MKDVTAIIKNFLRNGKTKKCIDSLFREYPDIKIVVIDDSYPEYRKEIQDYYEELTKKGHKILYTDFDIGVSAGRNAGMELVDTKYTLIGDNDFLYHKKSGVDKMRAVLEERKDIDVVCGGLFENGELHHYEGFVERRVDNKGEGYLQYTRLNEETCKWENVAGAEVTPVEIGFNYFLMRTEAFPRLSWSPEIKVSLEHSDGMLRGKQNGVKMVYLKDYFVENNLEKEGVHPDYGSFRGRFVGWKTFCKNWDISYLIDFDGYRGDFTVYDNEDGKRK